MLLAERSCLIGLAIVFALGCKSDEPATPEPEPEPTSVPAPPTARSADATPSIGPRYWVLDSPKTALEKVLEHKPRVLGIGELHQLTGSAPVESALQRFTSEMLDALSGNATDLVVETWVLAPNCGKKEKQVVKQVTTAIQRPPETENELVRLLSRARDLKMGRHVLKMSCEDHAGLIPEGQTEVDYWKLLLLVTERLGDKIQKLAASPDKMVVVYGGAHHNDLYPYDSLAEVSYVPVAQKLVGDRYVELDLYVPELVPGNELLEGEGWYPLLSKTTPDSVVLIERGKRSYILLMRKAKQAKSQK